MLILPVMVRRHPHAARSGTTSTKTSPPVGFPAGSTTFPPLERTPGCLIPVKPIQYHVGSESIGSSVGCTPGRTRPMTDRVKSVSGLNSGSIPETETASIVSLANLSRSWAAHASSVAATSELSVPTAFASTLKLVCVLTSMDHSYTRRSDTLTVSTIPAGTSCIALVRSCRKKAWCVTSAVGSTGWAVQAPQHHNVSKNQQRIARPYMRHLRSNAIRGGREASWCHVA